MAQKGKAKNKQHEREGRRSRESDDDVSRLTRQFRNKEHMAYPGQSHPGDEDLTRHLRGPFKARVLGRS